MQIVLPMVKYTPFVCVVCTWCCVRFTHVYLSTHVNNQLQNKCWLVMRVELIPIHKMWVVKVERVRSCKPIVNKIKFCLLIGRFQVRFMWEESLYSGTYSCLKQTQPNIWILVIYKLSIWHCLSGIYLFPDVPSINHAFQQRWMMTSAEAATYCTGNYTICF